MLDNVIDPGLGTAQVKTYEMLRTPSTGLSFGGEQRRVLTIPGRARNRLMIAVDMLTGMSGRRHIRTIRLAAVLANLHELIYSRIIIA
jgi:hypothetical protein